MTRTLTAAVALATALGMAGAVHAQGPSSPSNPAASTFGPSTPGTQAPGTQAPGTTSTSTIPGTTSGSLMPQASTSPSGMTTQPGAVNRTQPTTPNQPTMANQSNMDETNTQTVQQAQQALKAQGLYNGPIDGVAGPQTERAVSQFQRRQGLPGTASLDQQTLDKLVGGAASAPVSTQGRMPAQTR